MRSPFTRHGTKLTHLGHVSNLDFMAIGSILGLGLLLFHCICYYLSTTSKSKNSFYSIVGMYHVHDMLEQICPKLSQWKALGILLQLSRFGHVIDGSLHEPYYAWCWV